MSDLKALINGLNQNIGRDLPAKAWANHLPEKPPTGWGIQKATEQSRAAKCGQWLNVFAHLGFVERTATKISEKKVTYTFKPIAQIPYKDLS